MSRDETLSVIIRSSDPTRLPFLDQALFSLATQGWDALDILITLQNPEPDFQAEVARLAAGMPWPAATRWRVLPVAVPTGLDGRAWLLNEGVSHAAGRYLAFLDDDDVVYPNAYRLLVDKLQADPAAALAAGGCRMAYCESTGGHIHILRKERGPFDWGRSKLDLMRDNFIPIHSYVLDLDRIRPGTVLFRDAAVPLEDYDFLLRLAAEHGFNLAARHVPVCEYRIHGGNSLWANGRPIAQDVPPKLRQAREFVFAARAQTRLSLGKLELEALERLFAGGAEDTRPAEMKRFLHRRVDGLYRWLVGHPRLSGALLRGYLAVRTRLRR